MRNWNMWLLLFGLAMSAGAYACQTSSYLINGQYIVCTTCCESGICSTICN
jgi:hypothetical protein